MDPGRVRTCLDAAAGELGLGQTVDEVMMPAMRRIGRWWEIGKCDVGHEHIATEAVRMWLGRFIAFAPQAGVDQPVLLTCGPHDSHTLGMEALGALLAQRGLSCRLLGARTPSATLVVTARQVDPAAVIVVSHLSSARRTAVDVVASVAALGAPTFYAGNAFIASPIRQRLPDISATASGPRPASWSPHCRAITPGPPLIGTRTTPSPGTPRNDHPPPGPR